MRAFQISALVETAIRDERERGIIRSKALEDAAQQALDALYRWHMTDGETVELMPAFDALRAALAEPEERQTMTPKELAASLKRGEKWTLAEPVIESVSKAQA